MSERELAIDIVRGWGLEFDGTGDPKEFVGRIEDNAATYGIRLDHIAGAMMFLLKGSALNWWHANPIQVTDWITFKRQLNRHFVPGIRTGQAQRPFRSLLPWNRGNSRGPWEQGGGCLMTLNNNKGLITGPKQLRTEQPPMRKPQLLTDCFRQQEDEESYEDHGALTKNPREKTAEIPEVIQEAARLKEAQKGPGQRVNYKRSVDRNLYHVDVQLVPDQLGEDQTKQPSVNRPQLLADGGTLQQEQVIDIKAKESWKEGLTDRMELHPEGFWEEDDEATEIPLVIQQEARWRQAQKRTGKQVSYKRTVEGKIYRVKISRCGIINICQLKQEQVMDDQAEQPPTMAPQLLIDGETRPEDVMNLRSEESWEENYEVSLKNPSEETTEIPLVIQQEARWKQAQKRPGQQVCFEMSAEGKDYRVKISRSGNINVCELKPEQGLDDQKEQEQPPTSIPQLFTDRWTPQQEDVIDIHAKESCEEDRRIPFTNPSEETTEIPLVIQQEARFRQSHKRPGQQVSYKRSVEGKVYRVKISRRGIVSICQHTPDKLRDDHTEQFPVNGPQIPLVIQQEARWRQSHKRPGHQVTYKSSVEGKN